jgi:hypothetical protein
MGYLNKHDEREKKYRVLEKEFISLNDKQRNLGYKSLSIPIRHGWYIENEFSPTLGTISKYEELYNYLISREKTNTIWGRTKKEVRLEYDKRNETYGSVNRSLVLNYKEYLKLTIDSQALCVPYEVSIWNMWKNKEVVMIYFRAKIPPKFCSRKYIKCYITKRKNIDPNLISRIAYLENTMRSNKFYSTSWNGRSFKDWKDITYRQRRGNLKKDLEDLLTISNP